MEGPDPNGDLIVCKQLQEHKCIHSLIGLSKDEYVFLPNGVLYRNISHEFYKPGTFYLINGTVWICTNFSTNYTRYEESNHGQLDSAVDENFALVVLTYIGLSMSVIGLCLVLITFKKLRTLPGINVMYLSSCLLLSYSLYFATGHVESPVVCKVIAILLHYFFLVSFHWMSIIVFDTWWALSNMRVQRAAQKRRHSCFDLLRCIVLGWFPSFVFVAVCVALDQTKTFVSDYGHVDGCWINNRNANLFFFVLPVAVSMLSNSVFFSLTVKPVKDTNKQTQRITGHLQRRKMAVVFFKIFILMGFGWIFAFLRMLISPVFEYPFVITNTLQGVYIAVGFMPGSEKCTTLLFAKATKVLFLRGKFSHP